MSSWVLLALLISQYCSEFARSHPGRYPGMFLCWSSTVFYKGYFFLDKGLNLTVLSSQRTPSLFNQSVLYNQSISV